MDPYSGRPPRKNPDIGFFCMAASREERILFFIPVINWLLNFSRFMLFRNFKLWTDCVHNFYYLIFSCFSQWIYSFIFHFILCFPHLLKGYTLFFLSDPCYCQVFLPFYSAICIYSSMRCWHSLWTKEKSASTFTISISMSSLVTINWGL